MLEQNGYAQYQNSKILTASPAELMLRFPEGVQGVLMQLKSNGGFTTTLKNVETVQSS